MAKSLLPARLRIPFDPVPVAPRRDGWTPARQREFIDALSLCGSVTAAAGHAGMTAKSAYRLRNRPDASDFAMVWDRAQSAGFSRTRDDAVERAIHGERVPYYYRGRLVGARVRYNDRLAIAVLRHDSVRLQALARSIKANGSTDVSGDVA